MKKLIIYCCKDCGTKIDKRTALFGKGCCKPCSLNYQKGEGNPMFGKKLNSNHPFKQSKFGKNHPCFGLIKPQHSLRMTGKNNPNYKHGRCSKNRYCTCGKKLTPNTKSCQICFIKNVLFKRNFQRYFYKIWFKSSWEANFAKWLDLSGIKWEYEKQVFHLNKKFYIPDFYLYEFDCYIEIKGYWNKESKRKFKCWKNLFHLNYRIFYRKDLKQLSII